MLIGITTVNGPERVMACIRSFREVFPCGVQHRGVIVDDGSGQGPAEYLDEIGHLYGYEVIHHKDSKDRPLNTGIPAGWNSVARHAATNGENEVLVLNDDVEILPGSICGAWTFLRGNPKVATLGLVPLFRTPTGIQWDWPEGLSRDLPHRVQHSYGCAFFLHVQAWQDVGGFDERFKSHFEDVDFGIRVQEAGWFALNGPFPVLHDWSKTFKDNPDLRGHLRLEISRRKFREKWGKDPKDFPPLSPAEVWIEQPDGTGPEKHTVPFVARA